MMLVMQKTSWNIFAIVVAALICSARGQSPLAVTFLVADADRVAQRKNVEATFTFTPSAGGDSPSHVTLFYPSGCDNFSALAQPRDCRGETIDEQFKTEKQPRSQTLK
jgi:hypothetical protein